MNESPIPGVISFIIARVHHRARTQIAVEKDQTLFKVDRCIVPSHRMPLSKIPKSLGHRVRRPFNFVEEREGQISFLLGVAVSCCWVSIEKRPEAMGGLCTRDEDKSRNLP
jgi:hypothetical protein